MEPYVEIIESRIGTAACEKLRMITYFGDLPLFKHDDTIGSPDC